MKIETAEERAWAIAKKRELHLEWSRTPDIIRERECMDEMCELRSAIDRYDMRRVHDGRRECIRLAIAESAYWDAQDDPECVASMEALLDRIEEIYKQ